MNFSSHHILHPAYLYVNFASELSALAIGDYGKNSFRCAMTLARKVVCLILNFNKWPLNNECLNYVEKGTFVPNIMLLSLKIKVYNKGYCYIFSCSKKNLSQFALMPLHLAIQYLSY